MHDLEGHGGLTFVREPADGIVDELLANETEERGVNVQSTELDREVDALGNNAIGVVGNLLLYEIVILLLLFGDSSRPLWPRLPIVELLGLVFEEYLIGDLLGGGAVAVEQPDTRTESAEDVLVELVLHGE